MKGVILEREWGCVWWKRERGEEGRGGERKGEEERRRGVCVCVCVCVCVWLLPYTPPSFHSPSFSLLLFFSSSLLHLLLLLPSTHSLFHLHPSSLLSLSLHHRVYIPHPIPSFLRYTTHHRIPCTSDSLQTLQAQRMEGWWRDTNSWNKVVEWERKSKWGVNEIYTAVSIVL